MTSSRLIAGLGFRREASASSISRAVDAALLACGSHRTALTALATASDKATSPILIELAEQWRLPILGVATSEMLAVADRCVTTSDRVVALNGVPSIAEAAALAAAGASARLLCRRQTNAEATCAIAIGDDG